MSIHTTFTRDELAILRSVNSDEATAAIRRIAGDAARAAGMTLARVLSTDRTVSVARVRDVIVLKARSEGYSLPQIAKALKRDHSTILAAERREKARRGEA